MPDFPSNCVAFITGAGSGIGQEVARRLVADGITNLALIDITNEQLQDTVLSITSDSIQILAIGADCSKEAAVEDAVQQTVDKFGRIDVCFNAAGISGKTGKIVDTTSETLDKVLDLNLKGVWYCERAQIRQMVSQEEREVMTGLPLKTRGSIVNVASLASHFGLPGHTPYAMAKHAVRGLVKTDTVDYAAQGIRVNSVSPGWIRTPMTKFVFDTEAGDKVAARAPMNRAGLPEEIAYLVSFLLSDKASFIAGTDVLIDGGLLTQ